MDQLQQTQGSFTAVIKGDGEASYSRNSGLQASVNRIPLPALKEALKEVSLPSETGGRVLVADVGSGSGPNAISNVASIIEMLRPRLPKDAEFQAYFNDLPANDFNNLFQLLSNDSRAKNFFSAGVPGSYAGRLFPQSSVHVFFSSLCLQFVSKVPDAVLDKDSPAYNRGKIWYMHPRSVVAAAFQQQALQDLQSFLQARAAELVSGGLLFFFCFGRSTAQPSDPTYDSFYEYQEDFQQVWSELEAEGILNQHQLDSFNIPVFYRSSEDVKEAIASCGSLFRVLTNELLPFEFSFTELFATSGATNLSQKYAATSRAVINRFLESHIGEKCTDFWQRYEKLVEKRITESTQDLKFSSSLCVVALIRT